jgi:hypothetical protein
LGLLELPVWIGLVDEALAIPTRVARTALKLGALCSLHNLAWEAVEFGAPCSHRSLAREAAELGALCSLHSLAWEAVEFGAPCSHRSLAQEAVDIEAVCRLRIRRKVVNMAAPRASEWVAPDEPVRSGMSRAEADQSARGEWVPCCDTASGRALL